MPFQRIVDQLVKETPGAVSAVFVDWEGEAVVQAPRRGNGLSEEDDYQLKVLGAHKALLVTQIEAAIRELPNQESNLQQVSVRCEGKIVIAERVSPNYIVVLTIAQPESVGRARFFLRKAGQQLRDAL